jgi:hypothetical protein
MPLKSAKKKQKFPKYQQIFLRPKNRYRTLIQGITGVFLIVFKGSSTRYQMLSANFSKIFSIQQ